MKEQVPLSPSARAPETGRGDHTHEVAPDIAYRRLAMVNVGFSGMPESGDRGWVLIDTGVAGLTGLIESAAAERFGFAARPSAIILTHGHFDHVGGVRHLAEKWDVPVYAHALERPYLDGSASYPPPDPTTGGGIMPLLAPFLPDGPIDISSWLSDLPEDGSVPGMTGWRWLHTPGHSVGHISLWRPGDESLVVGDAFITTNQESAYGIAIQKLEMHGPPMYFTPDWHAARDSVAMLAALRPELVVTGHGRAMKGPEMRRALNLLATEFEQIAVPSRSPYLQEPARVENGLAYREP